MKPTQNGSGSSWLFILYRNLFFVFTNLSTIYTKVGPVNYNVCRQVSNCKIIITVYGSSEQSLMFLVKRLLRQNVFRLMSEGESFFFCTKKKVGNFVRSNGNLNNKKKRPFFRPLREKGINCCRTQGGLFWLYNFVVLVVGLSLSLSWKLCGDCVALLQGTSGDAGERCQSAGRIKTS